MDFCLSESHGGKQPTDTLIRKLTLFGFALIESIGNDLNRKDAVFYLIFVQGFRFKV